MKRLPPRDIDSDEDAQIMGIPLYILIIVIVAAVSLAAILGFMVTTEASVDQIQIEEVSHGDENRSSVLCEWITEDGTAYYKGSERPAKNGSGTVPPAKEYDQELVITVIDEDGNKMAGVKIEASGAGVSDVGTTNATGQVTISLDGCKLLPNTQNERIEITAYNEGLIGEETLENSIWVERP